MPQTASPYVCRHVAQHRQWFSKILGRRSWLSNKLGVRGLFPSGFSLSHPPKKASKATHVNDAHQRATWQMFVWRPWSHQGAMFPFNATEKRGSSKKTDPHALFPRICSPPFFCFLVFPLATQKNKTKVTFFCRGPKLAAQLRVCRSLAPRRVLQQRLREGDARTGGFFFCAGGGGKGGGLQCTPPEFRAIQGVCHFDCVDPGEI